MLDKICLALVDSNRRQILTIIGTGEVSAGEIAEQFRISQPAISQHLRVLLDADLVAVRRQGKQRLYRVHARGFDALRSYINQFWDSQLDTLKMAAEAEAREGTSDGDNEPLSS